MPSDVVPLMHAAIALRESYHRVRRRLALGDFGTPVLDGSRYYVSRARVEELVRAKTTVVSDQLTAEG